MTVVGKLYVLGMGIRRRINNVMLFFVSGKMENFQSYRHARLVAGELLRAWDMWNNNNARIDSVQRK